MDNRSTRGKIAALGGVLTALTVITLYIEAVTPVNKLSLYALSSFFISVVIIEAGGAAGWIFYAATCLLALFIVPDKVSLIPYAGFFGLYGLIKYYIEKLGRRVPELLLKLLFFNAFLAAAVLLINELVVDLVNIRLPWWALLAVFEVVFVIYDYVYSLFIGYYTGRIKKLIRM